MKQVLAALAVMLSMGAAQAATLTVACGSPGIGYELCKDSAELWAKRTGHVVLTFPTPLDLAERRALYMAIMQDEVSKVDVFEMDLYDVPRLRGHLLDLTPHVGFAPLEHFPDVVETVTYDDGLMAMPLYLDFGILYYRSDLLAAYDRPVPRSWIELQETAKLILEAEHAAGNRGLQGYVFGVGRDGEGLSVALEWIASHGGGEIVTESGTVTVNNPAARVALREAQGWYGDIVPESVLSMSQEDARRMFQTGRAIFMRNQTYVWPLVSNRGSRVYEAVGVTALPSGVQAEVPVTTISGGQLGVSNRSAHPELAADLVLFMTSRDQQLTRALDGAYAPTRPALYRNDLVEELQPFLAQLFDVFTFPATLPARQTGKKYDALSQRFMTMLTAVLVDGLDSAPALEALEADLNALRAEGWE